MKTIGIVGLGTMGYNLGLNLKEKGFKPVGHDKDENKVKMAAEHGIPSFIDLRKMIAELEFPRVIIVLVPASYVDLVLHELQGILEKNDIVIDGGNSNWKDTERRVKEFNGFRFIGMGISGGAEGARTGPSLMPGGDEATYDVVRPILEAISAKFEDTPCCAWMGRGGAGHFVKMVHNGIEYADMELICEAYDFLRRFYGNDEIASVFSRWNQGMLQSFLMEASSDILKTTEGGSFLIDDIIDEAGQKGTGKWTAINALELGIPLNVIGTSVNQRFVSSLRKLREDLSSTYIKAKYEISDKTMVSDLENALLFGRIMAYAEGLHLLYEAERVHGWGLKPRNAVKVWRAGCIIRSYLLKPILDVLDKPGSVHLLQSSEFAELIHKTLPSAKRILKLALSMNVPMPSLAAAIAQFESLTTFRLPANLIQAQRDYFGSHGFKRFSDPDIVSHWQWKGKET
ncbi:MAG: NADP-dependent phosphogluconate dehydrogenase [Methanobacteriota archaeon]|nr:MAG: NADP-dependent phosphogluconate dehydrogenase [Euryarchaeota archaeon]